jgi:hypothetical protein
MAVYTNANGDTFIDGDLQIPAGKVIRIGGVEQVLGGGGGIEDGETVLIGTGESKIIISGSEEILTLLGDGFTFIEANGAAGVISLAAPNGLALNGVAVTIGAADSGGTGFRVLRIPN